MKSILSIILSFLAIVSFAQEGFDFDKKTSTAMEGTTPLFTIEKVKGNSVGKNLLFKNMSGKEIFVMKYSNFYKDSEKSSSNPEGRVIFMEFIFPNTSSTCEVQGAGTLKHYAKMVYDNKLIVNGELDPVSEERFIKITGNDFSRNRDASNIIIINNSTTTQQQDGIQIKKNGVNISIGN